MKKLVRSRENKGMNMVRAFILVLFLLLTGMLLMGCGHEVSSERSYLLRGENEEWAVDYQITFTTTFPEENGKQYAKKSKSNSITVTFKKDITELSDIKNMKISYKDSFGSGGSEEQNYDEPLEKKVFRLGGGSSSSKSELVGFLAKQENFYQAMTIYGSPAGDGVDQAHAAVTVEADDRIEQIQLKPVTEIATEIDFLEILKDHLSGIQVPSYYFSELNFAKPDLKLISVNKRITSQIDTTWNAEEEASVAVVSTTSEGIEAHNPLELTYEFVIQNIGKNQIGNYSRMGSVEIQIVSGNQLASTMNQILGQNPFELDTDGYPLAFSGSSMKGGLFSTAEECKLEQSYYLQPYETANLNERNDLSEEQKKEILDRALDAVLIIKYKGEPLARFNLKDYASI